MPKSLPCPAGKQFGTTVKLGEEFFQTVAHMDFKERTTSFPWLRGSLLSANLSSPRSTDGIGKCLTKQDCQRLVAKNLRTSILQAETMLAMNWNLVQKQPWKDSPKAYSLQGRCMVRMALHLAKKEAKGRDSKEYQNLAAISTLFSEELVLIDQAPLAPAVAQSSSAAPAANVEPETLQATCCVCCFQSNL